jgi:hypothetical protein
VSATTIALTPTGEPATAMACPDCGAPIAERVSIVMASVRAAAKRPVTPEVLVVCGGCTRMFVVSLHPARERHP